MRISTSIPNRRNIALPGHPYKQGSYFVTLRVIQGKPIFGEVVQGEMRLNELGRIIEEEWLHTPLIRPNVSLDAHIVMPNHFHGIINIEMPSQSPASASGDVPSGYPGARGPASGSLSAILGQFKSLTTKRCRATGYDLSHALWLRRWYDRVIRSDSEKADIRRYIWDNPIRWEQQGKGKRGVALR